MNHDEFELIFKIVLIGNYSVWITLKFLGDAGVGKSSIMMRFVKD